MSSARWPLRSVRSARLPARLAKRRAGPVDAAGRLPIVSTVAGLHGAGRIGEAVRRVIGKHKVGKHFHRTVTDTSVTYHRNETSIHAEARLELRTCVPATDLDAAAVVTSYKNLAHNERDFRSIKTDDLDQRPIHHRRTSESAPTC
jgi:hypothetical protein